MHIEEQQAIVLAALQEEIQKYALWIGGAIQVIHQEGISNYPIVIAHKETQLGLGVPIIDRESNESLWSFAATTLEELVQRGVWAMERVDSFRNLYKEKTNSICVFILTKNQSQCVFLPFVMNN